MFQATELIGTYNSQGYLKVSFGDKDTWFQLVAKGKTDLSKFKDGQRIKVSGSLVEAKISKGTGYLVVEAWNVRSLDDDSSRITAVGRLGRDPELRHTPNGSAVCNFSIAVDRGKDIDPVWFRVAAWGRQAETCNQYLHKGDKVLVAGNIDKPKPYTGNDGTQRANLSVTATNVRFLQTRRTESQSEAPAENYDEEIPF